MTASFSPPIHVPSHPHSHALPSPPHFNEYIKWVREIMGVPIIVLPNNSPYLHMSYNLALAIVNKLIDIAAPGIYTIAVYNLAGNYLVYMAQDNPALPPPDNTYWADLRKSLQINNFVPGLINATNDEDTSAAITIPTNLQNLTVSDLQALKTPWGQTYIGIAQSVGSMWGITF